MGEVDRELTSLENAPQQHSPAGTEGGGGLTPSRLLVQVEISAAVLLCIGAAMSALFMPQLIGSGGIETPRDFLTLSPGVFPQLAMILLAAVSLFYAVDAWRSYARVEQSHTDEDVDRLKRAGFMVVVAICYASLISWMGFILSTMLVAGIVSWFLGLRKPLTFLPGVVVAPIAIRFVFERLLYIALPRSEIEFVAAIEDFLLRALVWIFL
jgi:hypothetical protein